MNSWSTPSEEGLLKTNWVDCNLLFVCIKPKISQGFQSESEGHEYPQSFGKQAGNAGGRTKPNHSGMVKLFWKVRAFGSKKLDALCEPKARLLGDV
jgi:hypothetical protein